LLPYPYHRDQHQAANAAVLADGGAALVLEDTRDAATNAPAVLSGLESLADPERRARMAASARALARPDAAERVADWLLAQSAHSPG
jgi:UDP-N-acetylglucosamine--N-acetylmuramyl-(pentapeptide) pyrophosphoryl-undecaprenol N-acetylglucosamine transferase